MTSSPTPLYTWKDVGLRWNVHWSNPKGVPARTLIACALWEGGPDEWARVVEFFAQGEVASVLEAFEAEDPANHSLRTPLPPDTTKEQAVRQHLARIRARLFQG